MCVLRVYAFELLLLNLSVSRDSFLSDGDGYPRALEKNLTLTGGGHTGSPVLKMSSLKIGDSWIQHVIKLARNTRYRQKQQKTIIHSNTGYL